MNYQFVRANGVTLCFRDHPGGEPTLVLLPGLTVGGAFFEALVGAGLSPHVRSLAFDLRGRGRSDAPPGGLASGAPATNYSMADHAGDILSSLDVLGVRQPILVGHSFGGMLALYLAAHAPPRFPRIVLLDAAVALAAPATREPLRPPPERLDQVKPTWEAYLDALRRQPYFDGWWDPDIEAYFLDDAKLDADGGVRTRARPDAIRAAVEGMLAVNWPAVVSRVAQPVLLVNAEGPFGPPGAPPFLPKTAATQTAEALADCRFITVPGNHITMAFGESARAVASAIVSFVGV